MYCSIQIVGAQKYAESISLTTQYFALPPYSYCLFY